MAQEDRKNNSQSYDLQSKVQRHGRLVLNDRRDRQELQLKALREEERERE